MEKPNARSQGAPAEGGCPRCGKPPSICVCDRLKDLTVRHHVLILQHPQEQDVALGSVPLLLLSVARARRAIGLSWPGLAPAVARAWKDSEAPPSTKSNRRWAVMYPASLKRELTPKLLNLPFVLLDANGVPESRDDLIGLVVLDGTWSQVKTLWWRNPWLLKLPRAIIHPQEPSIYGRARREPKRNYVSTLEAVTLALDGLGEDHEVGNHLRRLFRTSVQRARDAAKSSQGP